MRSATITVDGKSVTYPVVESSLGDCGIDISKLRADTGLITLDIGLGNTGSCKSAITYIDGDAGILRYRGYPIEDLCAQKPNFIEIAWLLNFGQLPNNDQYDRFSERLTRNAYLHEGMRKVFDGFPPKSPPMAVLAALFNALACYHPEMYNLRDDEELFEEAAARLISKVRTLAAYIYRYQRGLPNIYPDPKLRYAANFLHLMFSMPNKPWEPDRDLEEAMNLIWILHADHEQNCSTSTVRIVGSSQANLFTSVAAGVSALWGPLHGGANVEVISMLEQIHAGGLSVEQCIAKAKDKNDPFRLMGFGHRVYKNFDPRSRVLRTVAEKLFQKIKRKDPLLDIARGLEEAALKDPYFLERKLYPNVDFYSGIIMRAMGIPTSLFTVMFAIGRLPGWIAQWKEQHDDPQGKILRPRQVYTGAALQAWKDPQDR